MTDNGTNCAWVIHESKAVQIHVHNNCGCLYVPWVPGSVKNPHSSNINNTSTLVGHFVLSPRERGSKGSEELVNDSIEKK